MKISNSNKQLAKIIHENGGWREGAEFTAQDGDGTGSIDFFKSKPRLYRGDIFWKGDYDCDDRIERTGVTIKNWHQTILSRAEYFHLYPAPDADGWIEWKGGECPVDGNEIIDIRYPESREEFGAKAKFRRWNHARDKGDIIAYRLHKLEQSTVETRLADAVGIVKAAAPALMSDEMKLTGDEVMGEIKPTLDRLLQDWRNAEDFAKRKQAEADESAAMRDERWNAVQARAGEMGVTVERKI